MSRDKTAYLVFDAESVPDGRLIGMAKYPKDNLTPEEAVARAQQEASDRSPTGSDFLPPTFQYPVGVVVAKVNADFELLDLTALDAPEYRPEQITRDFWLGVSRYRAAIVTFNGRGFDIPLLELAAYRYGLSVPDHFAERYGTRDRFAKRHIDMMDWLANFGASRMHGGLNLLAKLLGKPGKMETTGAQVYTMFCNGQVEAINQYCMFDVLDTYFVFLRTRVVQGELTINREQEIVGQVREWLTDKVEQKPHLQIYLDHWGDWDPWP